MTKTGREITTAIYNGQEYNAVALASILQSKDREIRKYLKMLNNLTSDVTTMKLDKADLQIEIEDLQSQIRQMASATKTEEQEE